MPGTPAPGSIKQRTFGLLTLDQIVWWHRLTWKAEGGVIPNLEQVGLQLSHVAGRPTSKLDRTTAVSSSFGSRRACVRHNKET